MVELCMDVAPGHVAFRVPPPPKGKVYRTPWCHLDKGHDGPHQCGDLRWANAEGADRADREGEP